MGKVKSIGWLEVIYTFIYKNVYSNIRDYGFNKIETYKKDNLRYIIPQSKNKVLSNSEKLFPGKYDKDKVNYDNFAKIYFKNKNYNPKTTFNKKYFSPHLNKNYSRPKLPTIFPIIPTNSGELDYKHRPLKVIELR